MVMSKQTAHRKTTKTPKRNRMQQRATDEQRDLIQRGADMEGRSVTDFMLAAAQEKAVRIIESMDIIRLNAEESRRFVEALGRRRRTNLTSTSSQRSVITTASFSISDMTFFRIERLGEQNRAAFSCGVEPLDHYLKAVATQDMRRGLATCFVAIHPTQARLKVTTHFRQQASKSRNTRKRKMSGAITASPPRFWGVSPVQQSSSIMAKA